MVLFPGKTKRERERFRRDVELARSDSLLMVQVERKEITTIESDCLQKFKLFSVGTEISAII